MASKQLFVALLSSGVSAACVTLSILFLEEHSLECRRRDFRESGVITALRSSELAAFVSGVLLGTVPDQWKRILHRRENIRKS